MAHTMLVQPKLRHGASYLSPLHPALGEQTRVHRHTTSLSGLLTNLGPQILVWSRLQSQSYINAVQDKSQPCQTN